MGLEGGEEGEGVFLKVLGKSVRALKILILKERSGREKVGSARRHPGTTRLPCTIRANLDEPRSWLRWASRADDLGAQGRALPVPHARMGFAPSNAHARASSVAGRALEAKFPL